MSGYVWTGKNDLKMLRWTRIFSKTGEKSPVFKNIQTRVDRTFVYISSKARG